MFPTGSPGLPPASAKEQAAAAAGSFTPRTDLTESGCRFHVRVLVPCYKEPLSVIAATMQAALSADLPSATRRWLAGRVGVLEGRPLPGYGALGGKRLRLSCHLPHPTQHPLSPGPSRATTSSCPLTCSPTSCTHRPAGPCTCVMMARTR